MGPSLDKWAHVFDAPEWLDDTADIDAAEIRAQLRERYENAEQASGTVQPPSQLVTNISRLSSLLGLSEPDCRILELVALVYSDSTLDEVGLMLGTISNSRLITVLATLLALPEQEISKALSPHGMLVYSGLITIDNDAELGIKDKFNVLSRNFIDKLCHGHGDPLLILRDILLPAKPPTLSLSDYFYQGTILELTLDFLDHALHTKRPGTNILLYGQPGTGKSELARVLCLALSCDLYEVTSEDSDGDPVESLQRLRAFRAAQYILRQRKVILCFDEVEDVLAVSGLRRNSGLSNKASLNRILEENHVPTIWISNSVSYLDKAFIRRFDIVIELPIPSLSQRQLIVRKVCRQLGFSEEQFLGLAKPEHLSPAVLTRAISVVQAVGNDLPIEVFSSSVKLLVSNTLHAQGYLCNFNSDPIDAFYDVSLVNTDIDLAAITAEISKVRGGRLCLFGQPGTGKTAFSRWLAQSLNTPLRAKHASDLLSMYVGGTEHNISRAFAEARDVGAVLVIDEIDSFLQDRRFLQRSWEVTAVNEMLVQIENYPGILIVSTNLMENLDHAAMRRFDIKIRFSSLTAAQSQTMFSRSCQEFGLSLPDENTLYRVGRIPNLTLGDFAVIIRQHRFQPITSLETLFDRLNKECHLKQYPQPKTIGFL